MNLAPLDEEAGLGDAVARINQNTALLMQAIQALQVVTDSFAAALPASVADRAALHRQADATDARLATTTTAANTAKSAADAAAAALTALAVKQPRAASAAVPAVTNVLTTISVDVGLTWPMAWPDGSYTVLPVLEVPTSLLGKVSVAVKSRTATTTVLTVTTSAVLAAGAVTVRAASFA